MVGEDQGSLLLQVEHRRLLARPARTACRRPGSTQVLQVERVSTATERVVTARRQDDRWRHVSWSMSEGGNSAKDTRSRRFSQR